MMDPSKQKLVSIAQTRTIVTRRMSGAIAFKADNNFNFAKRKAESPAKMLSKKTVFKDLTNREAIKEQSYTKFQNNVSAAAKRLARTKIGEITKTQVTRTKVKTGTTANRGGIGSYFRVTKQPSKTTTTKLPKSKKEEPPPVAKCDVKKDAKTIAPLSVLDPVLATTSLPNVKRKVEDKVQNVEVTVSTIDKEECKSASPRDSISPLYVTALEDLTVSSLSVSIAEIDPTVPPKRSLPDGVTDFDAENWTDPFQASNYATDIFNYFKSLEAKFRIKDYMPQQVDLTTGMRAAVVDWMVELQENFALNHETLYLAVKLLDAYLCKEQTPRNLLQLVGATSLFIASKYDERFPPSVEDHLYVCDGTYTKSQLMAMEINILRNVDYNLGFPISYRFLRRYARFGKVSMPTLTLARYILECSLMDYSFISESDSKLAASALLLALKMKGNDEWSPNLQFASGYSVMDLKDTTVRLNAMLRTAASTARLTTVKNKYSHKLFFEVAKLPLLHSLDF